ncbi:MAG: S24 family peptidase [Flavobacteriaceae bacterium]|nr:S24 family peptidase [Flavobacteriaceae bacterium]
MEKNSSSIKQRILHYAENKGYSKRKIYVDTGISNGTLDKKSGLSEDSIEKFCSTYKEVNPTWLLTGEGEMLRVDEKRNMQKMWHNKSTTKSTTFSPKTKSVENVVQLQEDINGIPLIPIDAMAGFGAGSHQVMEYDTRRYIVPEFTELKVDFMIRVKGSSMYPKYNSGDLVACKKLSLQDAFFQWNKVYVLDTEQGALIKRIRKTSQKDQVLIVSDNESYESFELHLSKVNAIALVVGVIRLE